MLPNNLGDVIMTLPLLASLKSIPETPHITFVAEEGYEGGLLNSPYCDRIVTIPRKTIKQAAGTAGWRHGIELLRELVEQIASGGCDHLYNLSQHPYLSHVASLVKAAGRSGRYFLPEGNHTLRDPWSQYLYAIPFARHYNELHAADVYCRIGNAVNGRPDGTLYSLKVLTGEKNAARRFLADKNFSIDRAVAVFQPGAAWQAKRWPEEAFAALGKMLVNDGYGILITGSPAERDVSDRIAGALGTSCLSTSGELSFRESIALLAFADWVVTGDTAIMHAAAALGRKVVALFGPTSPVETGPYGSGHRVVCGKCPQRPCFRTVCPTCLCMKSIRPETVYGCIRDQTVSTGDADIFTTGFDRGIFRLIPVDGHPNPFFHQAGAALVRRVFEVLPAPGNEHSLLSEVEQSRRFIAVCKMMESSLAAGLSGGGSVQLQRFEALRGRAAALEGVTTFWNALLNIRLNSVPLLDPVNGISASLAVCRETRMQVEGALPP